MVAVLMIFLRVAPDHLNFKCSTVAFVVLYIHNYAHSVPCPFHQFALMHMSPFYTIFARPPARVCVCRICHTRILLCGMPQEPIVRWMYTFQASKHLFVLRVSVCVCARASQFDCVVCDTKYFSRLMSALSLFALLLRRCNVPAVRRKNPRSFTQCTVEIRRNLNLCGMCVSVCACGAVWTIVYCLVILLRFLSPTRLHCYKLISWLFASRYLGFSFRFGWVAFMVPMDHHKSTDRWRSARHTHTHKTSRRQII